MICGHGRTRLPVRASKRPLMNRRADVPEPLVRKPGFPAARIDYLEEADESIFREISCGVLFVMAFWSGPSWKAFARLKEVLSKLDPEGKLQFVVVNTD